MPVPSGFCVGNYLDDIYLLLDVSHALDDKAGSAVQCQSLIFQLNTLKCSFLQIESAGLSSFDLYLQRIGEAVLLCEQYITEFVARYPKYEEQLGSHAESVRGLRRLGGPVRARQCSWCSKDDLATYHASIQSYMSSIQELVTWAISWAKLTIALADYNHALLQVIHIRKPSFSPNKHISPGKHLRFRLRDRSILRRVRRRSIDPTTKVAAPSQSRQWSKVKDQFEEIALPMAKVCRNPRALGDSPQIWRGQARPTDSSQPDR